MKNKKKIHNITLKYNVNAKGLVASRKEIEKINSLLENILRLKNEIFGKNV